MLSSKELNILIYRYLIEAGFLHSSYTFGHESLILEDGLFGQQGQLVAPGALISLLQKGLKFLQVEAHLNEDGSVRPCHAPFSLLRPHVCQDGGGQAPAEGSNSCDSTGAAAAGAGSSGSAFSGSVGNKAANHYMKVVQGQKEKAREDRTSNPTSKDISTSMLREDKERKKAVEFKGSDLKNVVAIEAGGSSSSKGVSDKRRRESAPMSPVPLEGEPLSKSVKKEPMPEPIEVTLMEDDSDKKVSKGEEMLNPDIGDATRIKSEVSEEEVSLGTEREVKKPAALLEKKVPLSEKADKLEKEENRDDLGELYLDVAYSGMEAKDIHVYSRHLKQVFASKWNPGNAGLIASVGADGLGIIWDTSVDLENPSKKILDHRMADEDLDVTNLEWNRNGTQLATGDFLGNAYIWSEQGRKLHALKRHTGAVYGLRWNKKGHYLLTSSDDNTVILWDTSLGEVKQVFDAHAGPVYDVDWKTNTVFASGSGDQTIHVCKLHEKKPLRILKGHTGDVNAVRWDPSAQYLASCSDDTTVKVWDWENDANPLKYNLTGHSKSVYKIDWSPTGPRSDNPNMPVQLASASFDDLAKIWSLETGQCLVTLKGHTNYIYAITYSPDGQFIATGSIDKHVKIWSAKNGKLVRDFQNEAPVYDLAWHIDSDKLAMCSRNKELTILDFKY